MAVQEHASHSDNLLVVAIGSAASSGVWVAGSTGATVVFIKQHSNKHTTQYGVNGVYL